MNTVTREHIEAAEKLLNTQTTAMRSPEEIIAGGISGHQDHDWEHRMSEMAGLEEGVAYLYGKERAAQLAGNPVIRASIGPFKLDAFATAMSSGMHGGIQIGALAVRIANGEIDPETGVELS